MAARLTDRQKQKIIADYLELGSYNATAKINGVSDSTVKRAVRSCGDFTKKAEQKKNENIADMLSYMDARKAEAQGIIDKYLEALADPDKIEGATLSQIATAMGIVIDKFMKTHTEDAEGAMPDLIRGLKEDDTIHTETKSPYEDVADEQTQAHKPS